MSDRQSERETLAIPIGARAPKKNTEEYKTGTSIASFTSIRLKNSGITIEKARELIREKLHVKHVKLFASIPGLNGMFVLPFDTFGLYDFMLSFSSTVRLKKRYFLAVSANKPFDNGSFDPKKDKYCLIYVKKEGSVVFVKDKILRPEDVKEEQFPRLIKYAAGVIQEEDYEVVYDDIKQSNQGGKINWIKQHETLGNLIFCLVYPKIQE